MGGLAAILGSMPDPRELERMTATLAHRGTADRSVFSLGTRSFLHARLSIGGGNSLPVVNDDATACIAFSGRIANRRELLDLLPDSTVQAPVDDAHLVLRLYDALGDAFLERMDGGFAFVIDDLHRGPFVARDPLGLQPLYIRHGPDRIHLASEIKAMAAVVRDYREFPAGCCFRPESGFMRYFRMPDGSRTIHSTSDAIGMVQEVLDRAVARRVVKDPPMGVFLSGGLDSSIIAALTARYLPGVDTFAVGMEGSEDLEHARLCARHLGTRHHESVYTLSEMLSVLTAVILHLESFDAALVRSSVANYLLAELAGRTVRVVFSGEGADELFCGYPYMKDLTERERVEELPALLGTLHNTGLQRGDRMAGAHGIETLVPFLDMDFVRLAFQIPDSMKIGPEGQEKWLLRRAFAHLLPLAVVTRRKQKFSVGAGSSLALAQVADMTISDPELERESFTDGGHPLRTKEELMYYRIFRRHFPHLEAEAAVGFSRSL